MKHRKLKTFFLTLLLLTVIGSGIYYIYTRYYIFDTSSIGDTFQRPSSQKNGKLVSVESIQTLTPEQVHAISRQNYGAAAPAPTGPVIKAVLKYTSLDDEKNVIHLYARAYIPASGESLPVFGFAPGTTGIGDQCAASLEQPAVKNWANYESHMATYAGQGYASIITDYEGMRDPSRLHHYMVGELEGRAVLDSVLVLQNWADTKNRVSKNDVFVGGFSQGGHSAMWADKIQRNYAPQIPIKGVVGFGPVSDVKRTLEDVGRGANLTWFGPLVLASYSDYYKRDYELSRILTPKWSTNLTTLASSNCIDSFGAYWGRQAGSVYQPAFLQALNSDTLTRNGFNAIDTDLKKNAIGDQKTSSAKLINQGAKDNVIFTGQQTDVLPKICRNSKGSVALIVYPQATHYNVMTQSFNDTLNWMNILRNDQEPPSTCPNQ